MVCAAICLQIEVRMGCTCCKRGNAVEEEEQIEKYPLPQEDENNPDPLQVKEQERTDIKIDPLIISNKEDDEPDNLPCKKTARKLNTARSRRDHGIRFYDSSKTNNGSVAKYLCEIKGRTKSVYNADPAHMDTVRNHPNIHHRPRTAHMNAVEISHADHDLSKITEQDDGSDIMSQRPPQESDVKSTMLNEERKDFDVASLLLDDSESHCSVDGCDCQKSKNRKNEEEEKAKNLGMQT